MLRSLGLASWDRLDHSINALLINEVLQRLGPRLERFLFILKQHLHFHVLGLNWTHFISLYSLTLDILNAGNLIEVLRRVPANFATLRLSSKPKRPAARPPGIRTGGACVNVESEDVDVAMVPEGREDGD